MILFPAIDIRSGKVVRLTKGDYDNMKTYSSDPLSVARSFIECGATHLHTVDLDGAKDGCVENLSTIDALVKQGGLFVQTGGGIRNEDRIKRYLDLGVSRVILGTVAVDNFAFVESMAAKYGEKIAVGVDALNERVAVCGWKKITDINSFSFCERLASVGVKTVIYTDISKDGAMAGANLAAYDRLRAIDGLNVIASGGITFYDELKQLNEFGVYGAILGKALYEGLIDLKRAVELVEARQC